MTRRDWLWFVVRIVGLLLLLPWVVVGMAMYFDIVVRILIGR